MAENCTSVEDVYDEGPTCQAILDQWDLTIELFYEWNPSVGPDCGGMWAGKFGSLATCTIRGLER